MTKKVLAVFLVLLLALGNKTEAVSAASVFPAAEYREKAVELRQMLKDCASLGLDCDYETMYTAIFERFIQYAEENAHRHLSQEQADVHTAYVKDCLDALYTNTKNALEGYLQGEGVPLSVPQYQTSPIAIDGKNTMADTTLGRRPVFFVGYGHFDYAANDFPNFNRFGVNMTQQDIGPNRVIFDAHVPYGWQMDQGGGFSGSVTTEFEEMHSGQAAVRFSSVQPRSTGAWTSMEQTYAVQPNTTYTFGLSAKSTGASALFFRPAADVAYMPVEASEQYRDYSSFFTTGADQTSVTFTIRCEDSTQACIDDIYVRKGTMGENLLNNGDFEKNTDRFGQNGSYIFVADHIYNDLLPKLDSAADSNVAVSLLLSPHYFPSFVYEKYYPDMLLDGTPNVYHPQYQAVLLAYIDRLIPIIQGHPALHDICLSNEPRMNTAATDASRAWFADEYRAFLRWQYEQDISALNHAYGTQYQSFDAVPVPETTQTGMAFSDWKDFNDQKCAQWHGMLANRIRSIWPEAVINAKAEDYFTLDGTTSYAKSLLQNGTEAEGFAAFSDMMGNDAHAYLLYFTDQNPLLGKMKWYDFLGSMKDVPVFNSENHIIPDNQDRKYDGEQAPFIYTDIFQGAVHGNTSNVIWAWEKNEEEAEYIGNITYRPDCVAAVGKATYDLNRLAYEIARLQDSQELVGILYSVPSRINNPYYLSSMHNAYLASVYAGRRVEFVTENTILSKPLPTYKALIVPYATHVSAACLSALHDYVNAGGKLILIDRKDASGSIQNETLAKDECGLAHTQYVDNIRSSSTIFAAAYQGDSPSNLDINVSALRDVIYQNTLSDSGVKVCLESGEIPRKTEWRVAENETDILINLCNYGKDIEGVRVQVAGEDVAQFTDLISMREYSGAISLKTNEPVLLRIPKDVAVSVRVSNTADGIAAQVTNHSTSARSVKTVLRLYDQTDRIIEEVTLTNTLMPQESDRAEVAFIQYPPGGRIWAGVYDESGTLYQESEMKL